MVVPLYRLWDELRSSYWFVPGLMALGAVVLVVILSRTDRFLSGQEIAALGWFYKMGTSGARAILSTIIGSAITVTSVVFSITIVAISMASEQFGPRLIRNFATQGWSQWTLGVFIATFIYCLLVLTSIPEAGAQFSIPHLSVAAGLGLGVLSFAVLIYFIQEVTAFIQAPRIIDDVARDIIETFESLFPEEIGRTPGEVPGDPEVNPPEDFEERLQYIGAKSGGYVQAVNEDMIMSIVREADLLVRLNVRPGQFVVEGQPVALAYPAEHVNEEVMDLIARTFLTGYQRVPGQDAMFAIDQLVEVAVRALSPGINDPFTAINCIDRLSEALCFLARRRLPAAARYDEDGELRILIEPYSYDELVHEVFNQIRQNASDDVAVMLRLLEAIERVAICQPPRSFRKALELHAEMIFDDGQKGLANAEDCKVLEKKYRSAIQAFELPAQSTAGR